MAHQDALSGGTQKETLGELARASLIIADRRTEAKNRGGLPLSTIQILARCLLCCWRSFIVAV
ncbi:MAG TPA: hypothetical protein VKI17_10430, partial [Gemmataceae bacterium]|nr:hypothetical protein [Gemmataceae bacterium]